MSSPQASPDKAADGVKDPTVDMKLEVIVISVSDVDRARDSYTNMGWRLDADVTTDGDFRVVQVTRLSAGAEEVEHALVE
jgi:catechol 2,3-dioxygenase-like lactoylglutathione lyase family enzyme